jgi:hypothetical protein
MQRLKQRRQPSVTFLEAVVVSCIRNFVHGAKLVDCRTIISV